MRNKHMKFITDLNGTILCPYQILLDISEQIPNNPTRITNLAFLPICELNSTNDWINLESLGKPVAIRAKTICDVLTPLLKNQNIVDLSLDVYCNNGLSSDNLFSLLYLVESFNSIELTFFTHAESLPCLKSSTLHLSNKKHISIHFKTDTHSSEMSANEKTVTHLQNKRRQAIKTLGFTFDDNFLNNDQIPEFILNQLIGFSWICLKSGGYDIACRLLEKIKNHAGINSSMQEQLFMHLLMIRFFSHQYALITESEFPEQFQFLGQSEVKTLQFLKAYSATLSRNLSVAHDFFKKCNITEQMPLTDEHSLYQLNLFALSKVLQGDTDTAFELEFRIKDFIKDHQIDTVGLKYVNFINIARLYKKIKDFDQSFAYYNKAYNEISGGGYTTSDHIYYNMNLGSLNEAAGNNKQALLYWVKTAMHWLACTNKYELSWRPRLILCQEKLSDVTKPLPIDNANTFLFNKIKELIQSCEVDITDKSPQQFQFTDDSLSFKKEHCFIKKNLLLFTRKQNTILSIQKPSPAEQKLSTLVAQYIQTVMAIPEHQNVFIIDTQLDTEFLRTAEEAMAFANLANCDSCYFNGQWLQLKNSVSIKPVNASLSKVIQALTQTDKGLLVQYKRSFLNKTLLDQSEIDVVNQLKETESLSLENIPDSSLNVISQLAKKRILNFSYAAINGSPY